MILVQLWGRRVYHYPNLLSHYGLKFDTQSLIKFALGLVLGIASLTLLFVVEGLSGWLTWQSPPENLFRILGEGLLVALGIGFAEELFFRGWLLDELMRGYSFQRALWGSSLIYAGLHFIKPWAEILRTWPEFPGLVFMGLMFVWGKYIIWPISQPDNPGKSEFKSSSNSYSNNSNNHFNSNWQQGNLGFPIGLHGGLVWAYYLVNVGNLIRYTGKVPEWITGIDQNPLAGIMGLLSLGAIALWVKKYSVYQSK
ncbi:MAG: CPBP family intramembrane metalloprotease [Oscillatoriales cyanobacterium RM2_1_1]|nr:CPBP family intramembrane metalloprotease [Oscillatoriales cyanobacterium SM2_3_0]NJO44978.1 CPBP family intramembrane metalloprotease [Oscillatoriales cyanobacterium RM2_1_1]